MTTVTAVKRTIESRDGTALIVRHWPVENPRARVLIVPGYADHSGRYEHVADWLGEAGLDVCAVDLRGHGESDGARGHVQSFTEYLEDVDALIEFATGVSEADKTFLLGHSMGGLVAINYGIERKPDFEGVIVTSPFLGVAAKVSPVKVFIGRMMSAVRPRLALPNEIDPGFLSRDGAVGEAYAADPLVFNTVTARWYTEAMAAIENASRRAGEFTLPYLHLQAGADRIADPSRGKPLHDRIGSSDKSFVEYPGFYHEILNETEKEKPLGDMRAWILERC